MKQVRIKIENGPPLDGIDRKILGLLQANAKTPQAEVAKRVGLSPPSVNERIRKLERVGYIRGYEAILDERKLGHEITAFVEVFVEDPRFEAGFLETAEALDEVLECHHITGEFSLLLKVRVRDIAALRRLLIERLTAVKGVRRTRTLVVLGTAKEQRRIRVEGAEPKPTLPIERSSR